MSKKAETKINSEINKAIVVPCSGILLADDGRQFVITAWRPCVELDGPVRVTAEFLVRLEDGKCVIT